MALHITLLLLFALLNWPANSQSDIWPSQWRTQECKWLEAYVRESSRRGNFPLGSGRLTWSSGHGPSIPELQREQHRKFVSEVVQELDENTLFSASSEDVRLFVFFHTKRETQADTDSILAELRSSARVAPNFPESGPQYEAYTFNKCSFGQKINPAGGPPSVTVLIPFDRKTGVPITDAKQCIAEGLLKASGIGLSRRIFLAIGSDKSCQKCQEADRRMIKIISDNNKSAGRQIDVSQMVSELSENQCHVQ